MPQTLRATITFVLLFQFHLFCAASKVVGAPGEHKPNIVYILCDDLGYGDVHCLNPEHGKIQTPVIDAFAAHGMTFTDCHAGASVCTPSRYGILTGRYAWRTRLQKSALPGDAPPLIANGRLTVAEFLKQQGYSTAIIGKWHLGLTFDTSDYSKPIADGPLNHGFDYCYSTSASADLPPFAYFENDRFTEVPTVMKEWNTTKWGAPGLAGEHFDWTDLLPNLTRRAVSYVNAHANDSHPFFLYLALTSPHTPLVPTKEWQGKSGIGDYGDFVMETDWAVGQVLAALDKAGVAQNTLVVFTSDNGCAPYIDIQELLDHGHYPSGKFSGYKFDVWEGGHRIPFMVRWPGHVKPGTRSDQIICLTDLLATCADVLDRKLPENAGEDSVSILPALSGTDKQPLHEAIVHQSTRGFFAIRQGTWVLALCCGAGGWEEPSEAKLHDSGVPPVQLYDLSTDAGEHTNLSAQHPDEVSRLTELLKSYIANGRSTPGQPQKNDAPVDVWKIDSPK